MTDKLGAIASVQAVAAKLEVSPATIRLWINKGYLPKIRIGSRIYVLWEQFKQQSGSPHAP